MIKKYLQYNPLDRDNYLKDKNEGELFYLLDFNNIKKDFYYVTSFGRIFSKKNGCTELPTHINDSGFLFVNLLNKHNKRITVNLHLIVSKVFVPKTNDDIINDKKYIMFKDGDKTNVKYSNLKWSTINEVRNTFDGNNKIDIPVVRRICEMLEKGYTVNECKNVLKNTISDISYNIIYNIATGRSWKSISKDYNIYNKYQFKRYTY